jgi:hypothetical protein
MKRDKRDGVRKNSYGFWRLVCGLLIALTIMTLPVGQVMADSPLLFPGQQMLYGKRISEWSAQWVQFVISFPQAENPLDDVSGARCFIGQNGPVWFLMGTSNTFSGPATRKCTIPEGTALFFPLVNLSDINTNPPPTAQPVRELRAEIAGCIDHAYNLSVEIDGVVIPAKELLDHARVRSTPFAVVLPPAGLPTIPPTPPGIYSPAVSDGYYVMLRPLSVGTHTLHFTGVSPGCTYSQTGFVAPGVSVDVTYNLTIEPVLLK